MPPDPTQRKLAAIMFTDIVGYTALMAESEEKGHRARQRHHAVLRPLVEQHHGEWVQGIGDESLSSFSSAVDAVNCALAIQAALKDEREFRVRVGIHLGDVVPREGSLHGDGVNVASRIRPLAQPGGVCVSEQVYDFIKNQPNVQTAPLGKHRLKNVARPVGVFAVGRPGEVSVRRATARIRRRFALRAGAAILTAVVVVAFLLIGLIWNRARQRACYYVREVMLTAERVLDDRNQKKE